LSPEPSPLGDQPTLLLGHGSVQVEHERVGVGVKLGDNERRAMRHQSRNEVSVAGQAVELGDDDRRLELPGRGQSGGELRASVEGVGALPGFYLREGLGQGVAFGLDIAGERRFLRFETKARSPLAGGRNASVGNGGFYGLGPFCVTWRYCSLCDTKSVTGKGGPCLEAGAALP
jgi:hypothetical protein